MSIAIRHLTTPLTFRLYESGLRRLLSRFEHVLLDDATLANADLAAPAAMAETEPGADASMQESRRLQLLVDNLRTAVPHIWLIVDDQTHSPTGVLGLCSLSDEIPGRHVYLHGISDPALRGDEAVTGVALCALHYAFEALNVLKVKAEFEADNQGARGFCWRLGFRREGLLARDILVGGICKDVALYTLSRDNYLRFLHRHHRRPYPASS